MVKHLAWFLAAWSAKLILGRLRNVLHEEGGFILAISVLLFIPDISRQTFKTPKASLQTVNHNHQNNTQPSPTIFPAPSDINSHRMDAEKAAAAEV